MSKVFLTSSGRRGRVTRILEATPDVAKDTFVRIKAIDPKSSVALFGARDIDTLKRTQPNLAVARVVSSVDDFIGHAVRTVAKVETGAKRRLLAVTPYNKKRRETARVYRNSSLIKVLESKH